ncbi:MAG: UDP-3-O-(3-hydroxymyristoyl)glucosamine N-acyltransferase, partial [Chitinivibrionales bacterium]|nr:UDP-3-O-(3-hydroxymyristoyl)glucosamine N-acyltransferase [Chitinivibrionales bacterium]
SVPEGTADLEIDSITSPEFASETSITFLSNPRYIDSVAECNACVVITRSEHPVAGKVCLFVDDPYVAYGRVAQQFEEFPAADGTVHKTAIIGQGTTVDPSVRIDAYAVIGDGCVIGEGTVIGAHTVIEDHVCIGDCCRIHPGVIIARKCRIGSRVIIECRAVIGSEGFANGRTGDGSWVRIPSFGIVSIGDDTWIGAGTCIDRGSFGATRIGKGVRLDNLIHIAHNVTVDDYTAMAAQAGIAGSCSIGKRAILAGQVGLADHITVGDDAFIGAKAGISKAVAERSKVTGYPARDLMKMKRIEAVQLSLPEMARELKKLRQEIGQLKKNAESEKE